MMLRSSSTPILDSLHLAGDGLGVQHLHTVACHLSPASDGLHDAPLGIRRTRSDGNIRSILSDEEHRPPPKCYSSSSRRSNSILDSIPSFSLYNPNAVAKEEEEEEEGEDGGANREGSDTVGSLRSIGSGSAALPPLFLARGLGIDRIGSDLFAAAAGDCGDFGDFGGCGGGKCDVLTGSGGEQSDVETYYKKMVEENPNDALFLRNYAEFLYRVYSTSMPRLITEDADFLYLSCDLTVIDYTKAANNHHKKNDCRQRGIPEEQRNTTPEQYWRLPKMERSCRSTLR